jgi:hypothetical protein
MARRPPRSVRSVRSALSAPRMVASAAPRTNHSHESPDKSECDSSDGESVSGESKNRSTDTELSADDSEKDLDIASATEWVFNEGLKHVLHDVDRCRMCVEFAAHHSDAKIRLHPSYHSACLACNWAIARDLQERIDGCRWQLEKAKKNILHLQGTLKGVRQEVKTAHVDLKRHRMRLEEARRDRAADNDSHTSISKSSQCPQSSHSPSPRPHKLPRHGSTL